MPTMATQPTLQAGGTLNPYEHLYVAREDVEDRLYSLLRQGEYCTVLSSRQVGKSSTVVKVGLRLQDEGARVVMIDLAGELGSPESAEQWYVGFLRRVAGDLGLGVDVKRWWHTESEGTPNQRFLQFFREVAAGDAAAPLVIVVDEIDSTLRVEYTDDFFTAIRTMYNTRASVPAYRRTTFCLVGVASPNELIKDRRTTAYNVGANVELRDFDPKQDDLASLYAAVSPDPGRGKRLVDAVFEWTDGHPYLTLRLCQEIVEREIATPDAVHRYMRSRFRSFAEVESDVHFEAISRFLGYRITEGVETMRLYSRILSGRRERDEATPRHIELKLAGIVKRNRDGLLVVRNRIYREVFNRDWVRGHLPFDWRKQLRRARIALVLMPLGILLLFLYATLQQQNLLASRRKALESANAQLKRSRDSLGTALAGETSALREARAAKDTAQAATDAAHAAQLRADLLRRVAEANALDATREKERADQRAHQADSLMALNAASARESHERLDAALNDQKRVRLLIGDGDILSRTVTALEQSGSIRDAVKAAERMLQLYQDAGSMANVAFAHERIGRLRAQLGEFDAAMSSLQSARVIRLQEQPGSAALADTYEAIGDVAWRFERDTLAIENYEAAVPILRMRGTSTERAEVFLKLARTLQRLHRNEASVASYDSTLSLLSISGTNEADRRLRRARVFREQAAVYNAMRNARSYRRALFQADSLEGNPSWTFAGSGGVGYQTVHGLGIGINESMLYTRLPLRPGFSVRGFWSFQDSSWTVSGGPTLSYAPFLSVPLETAADLHLGTTGSGHVRVVPGVAATVAVRSWSAVARAYWPAYDRHVRVETSVGVNLGFSPRDVFRSLRSEAAPGSAPAAPADSAAARRRAGRP